MSKKDRLKAQSQKQIKERRELEQQEREERENARYKQSRSAKKMMKKARYGRYGKEPLAFTFIKLLMLLPFAYSGIYYGGIMIVGTFFGYIDPQPPGWVGWCMLSGDVLILAGIIIEFFRKHISSFITIAAGTGLYLRASQYFIDYLQDKLENTYVEEELREMDKEYMMHFYPISAAAIFSLIILVWWIILKISASRKAKLMRDTAPVQSIVEE